MGRFEDLRAESLDMDAEETVTEQAESQPETETVENEIQTEEQETITEEAESQSEEYVPNFEYEIKGEKKEFPEWVRNAITSKEHEEQLRDYLTRAEAIDGIKESRSKVEEEFTTYKQEIEEKFNPVIQRIGQFDQHIAHGELGEAFKLAGIEDNTVLDHFLADENRLHALESRLAEYYKLQEAGPQAQQAYMEQQKFSQENKKLSTELEQLRAQQQQLEAQRVEDTMTRALEPHTSVMQQYDSKHGEGAFRNFVKKIGHAEWTSGNQMNPEQLVSYVVDAFNLGTSQAQPNQETRVTETTTEPPMAKPMSQEPAPTIPNIGTGSNASNVGKVAKTKDEYRRLLEEAAQAS